METTTEKRPSKSARERSPGPKQSRKTAAADADCGRSDAVQLGSTSAEGARGSSSVSITPWCGFGDGEQDALREEFGRLAQRDLTDSEQTFAEACVNGRDLWAEGFDPEGLPTLALAFTSLTGRPLVVLSAEAELLRARQIRFGARANCFLLDHESSPEARGSALAALQRFAENTQSGGALFWCTLESLRDPSLRKAIAKSRPLSLFIEGAHAASPKAHELRPSLSLLPALRAACGSRPSLVAFTRSAPEGVREDAILRLGVGISDGATQIVRAPLVPAGTRLSVVTPARQSGELTALVQRLPRPTAIFCATPHEADAVYSELSSAQVPVHRYHGGMPVSERATEMLHFTLPGRRAVMVATSAFQPGSGLAGIDAGPAATPEGLGLGFGRQKLRSLVHFCTPASLEQYAQELALLGTLDGPTEAVLCFAPDSLKKNEQAVFKLRVSDAELSAFAQALVEAQTPAGLAAIATLEQSCRIGRKATSRVLRLFADAGLVQLVGDGQARLLVSEGDLAQAVELLAGDLEQLRALDGERLDAVVGYVTAEGCRVAALMSRLGGLGGVDDAEAAGCGFCDRCVPESARNKESSQRSNEQPTMVVRRRPTAQIWSVKNPVADARDDDEGDEAEDDEELVVRRVASPGPGVRKIRG